MENQFLLTDELLWEYADGLLSAEEHRQVETWLRQHPEDRGRLDAVQQERSALFRTPLEQPDKGFSERVLAAWAAEQAPQSKATPHRKTDWRIYLVALAFLSMVLVPLVLLVLWSSALPAVSLPGAATFDYLPSASGLVAVLDSPAMHYEFYLLFAFTLLRLLDRYLHQRRVLAQLQA